MKQQVLAFLLLLTSVLSFAQTKISVSEASKHIGDSVQISTQVYGVKYLSNVKGSPTFINLGAAYPNQLLTAVIWQDVRDKMGVEPTEENLKNKTVIVIGKIEMYKGKIQIVIKDPSQFQVVGNDVEVLPFKNYTSLYLMLSRSLMYFVRQ